MSRENIKFKAKEELHFKGEPNRHNRAHTKAGLVQGAVAP